MNDHRAETRTEETEHVHLTVRDIRGLLTKHAQEVVHGMRTTAPVAVAEEAQPMSFREFVELMMPVIKMN